MTPRTSKRVKKLVLSVALLGALAVGCGGTSSPQTTTATTASAPVSTRTPTEKARPGDPGVYERIESLTDCNAIRREWDTAIVNTRRNLDAWETTKDRSRLAMADVTQSYSDAAEAQMHETGCYSP